jgi:hypothetical protein
MTGSVERQRNDLDDETNELQDQTQDRNIRAGASVSPGRRHHGRLTRGHARWLARRFGRLGGKATGHMARLRRRGLDDLTNGGGVRPGREATAETSDNGVGICIGGSTSRRTRSGNKRANAVDDAGRLGGGSKGRTRRKRRTARLPIHQVGGHVDYIVSIDHEFLLGHRVGGTKQRAVGGEAHGIAALPGQAQIPTGMLVRLDRDGGYHDDDSDSDGQQAEAVDRKSSWIDHDDDDVLGNNRVLVWVVVGMA